MTTADPGFAGRNAACGPYEDTIRATLVSLMVHVTIRPESCRPWASRSVAEKKTLSSPTTTVSAGGVTLTEATGGGAVTTSCAEALLPSLMAVMVVVPWWSARTRAVCSTVCSTRAMLESPTAHVTDRPLSGFP